MSRRKKDLLAVLYVICACAFFLGCLALKFKSEMPEVYAGEERKQLILEALPEEPEVSVKSVWKNIEVATVQQVTEGTEFCPEEYISVDDEELMLLARLIYAEAGSVKDDKCLYYVGSVVLNRMSDRDFPDTMHEVIYQTKPTIQYGCTIDGNIDKEPDERCIEIAEELLINGSWLPADVVYQGEAVRGSGVFDQIEGILFCYK